MTVVYSYGARSSAFRAAPKPANFDALTAAAAAHDSDTFQTELGRYRDQCNTAGVHPGLLLGVIDEHGDVS